MALIGKTRPSFNRMLAGQIRSEFTSFTGRRSKSAIARC
jgi:hypothetical protein